MTKKLYLINIMSLITYLWVISTLPLHSHQTHTADHPHNCEHSEHDHHAAQTDDDLCTICLNIHTPFAVDEMLIVSFNSIEFDYHGSYDGERPFIGYDNFLAQTTNKDPPTSMIS